MIKKTFLRECPLSSRNTGRRDNVIAKETHAAR